MSLAVLSIDLVAQLASLQSGMDKAGRIAEKQAAEIEARYKKMSAAASSVGAALGASLSVGIIVQFVRATVDGVDKLNDLSDATGASIENLSALEDIAARTGTSMDTAGAAIIKLNKALSDAKPKSDQAAAFEALGLSVEKLKKLDPAEAIRQVAIALSGYASDGNKARLVQELFGKSLAEVAPLLKDLAEKGEFNAKMTAEQTQRAEDFNKQLFELKKNSVDAARAIVDKLLPSLIELTKGWNTGGIRGLGDAIGEMIGLGKEYHATRNLKIIAEDLKLLELQFETAPKGPGKSALARQLEEKTKEYEAARNTYIKVRGLDQTTPSFRPSQNYGDTKAVLPDISGRGKDAKDTGAAKRLADYLATMKAQLEGEEQAVKDATEAWQFYEKSITSVYEKGQAFTSRFFTDQEKSAAELVVTMQEADRLVEKEAISWTTYGRAATSALKESTEAMNKLFKELPKLEKAPLEEINEFAQQAGRNIQDALGDTLLQTIEGSTENIGKIWTNMLKRLAAQAAAAQLGKYLLGNDFNSTGKVGGAAGELFKWFSSFGGARAMGGPVAGGRPYLVGERGPELMVPNGSGTVVPNSSLGGTQITYAPVFQFSDASAEQMGRIRAVARAEYARFARQMSVQGAI